MKHTYLTKREIDKAVKMKEITSSESLELINIIENFKVQIRSKRHLSFNSKVIQNALRHFI